MDSPLYLSLVIILVLAYLIIIFGYLVPAVMELFAASRIYRQQIKQPSTEPISDSRYFHALFKLLAFFVLLLFLTYLKNLLQSSSLAVSY